MSLFWKNWFKSNEKLTSELYPKALKTYLVKLKGMLPITVLYLVTSEIFSFLDYLSC